jgi:benzil reductase ((S)-benzoin forming)
MNNVKAILTGHTKGLGAALAQQLLERKIPVLALARTSSQQLQTDFPELLTQIDIDLSVSSALAAWLQTNALRDYLHDCSNVVLINNAGTVAPVGSLSQQDPLEVAAAISLNVSAPLTLAAAVVGAMQGKHRRILHISSGAGSGAYAGWSVYCATKAALDHHARAVALDAEEGVRICSLAPGIIDTDMQATIRATPEERFPSRQRFVDLKREGQLVTPADCAARLINHLLSDKFGDKPVDDLRHYG